MLNTKNTNNHLVVCKNSQLSLKVAAPPPSELRVYEFPPEALSISQ